MTEPVQRVLGLLEKRRVQRRSFRLAVLGPHQSGKTEFLKMLRPHMETADVRFLDLPLTALEMRSEQDFFAGLLDRIGTQATDAGLTYKPRGPAGARLHFVERLKEIFLSEPRTTLLVFDNMEVLPHEYQRSLVRRVREMQETELEGSVFCNLGFVLCGAINLFTLMRQVDSPTLQFDAEVFPLANPGFCRALARTQAEARGVTLTDPDLQYLVAATGGQPVLMAPLLSKLKDSGCSSPTSAEVRSALESLERNGGTLRLHHHLRWHFCCNKDLHTTVRQLNDVPDAPRKKSPLDVDPFQLIGAMVVEDRGDAFVYRYRTPSVGRFLTELLRQSDSHAPGPMTKLQQLRTYCLECGPLDRLAAHLRDVWKLVCETEEPELYFCVCAVEDRTPRWIDPSFRGVLAESVNNRIPIAVREAATHAAAERTTFVRSDELSYALAVPLVQGGVTIVVTISLPHAAWKTGFFCEDTTCHWINFVQLDEATRQAIYVRVMAAIGMEMARRPEPSRSRVFLVHGRDQVHKRSVGKVLDRLGLTMVDFETALDFTASGAPTNLETVSKGIETSYACIVLLTPDDEARIRSLYATEDDETVLKGQARPNVLLELGMALGRDRHRTVLVQVGSTRRASDIDGVHTVALRDGEAGKLRLARRLAAMGCDISEPGRRWLNENESK